ncbi:hypothetical protein HZA71_01035 [Candidatus Falkowbacteria bacterium]|nr:hypothetical protein [Candidatus Falkowbacteria bacterium]
MVINKIIEKKNTEIKPEAVLSPEPGSFNIREKEAAPMVERPSEKIIEPVAIKHMPPLPPSMPGIASAPAAVIDEDYRQIESILEEDLEDIYLKMPPLEQQKLKVKGEETIWAILRLMAKPKVKIKKIIGLIRNWLKLITGINKFFLEQLAKIKADKIIKEARENKKVIG